MRLLILYGIAVIGAFFIWLSIRLEQTYRIEYKVKLWPLPESAGYPTEAHLQVEGTGYALLFWKRIDTISPVRLCFKPPQASSSLRLTWEAHPELCKRIRRFPLRPIVRWIMPEGMDFVVPPTWVSDSVWAIEPFTLAQIPEVQLVARSGKHLYPVPVPMGVYPETLWVQAHITRFIPASVELTPILEDEPGRPFFLRPAYVTVRFWIPESHLKEWKRSDFEVVVNVKKVLRGDSVVYPELRKRYPHARYVEISPNVLHFSYVR
ncbi:MAG: hypothetical protein NZ580_03610 [Bacteroidia bacterium]|nr:hypothetical protein [Bacteroidia bacterium]MDW8235135.1 hypothetical protein [Bacteroidia bacterium]